MRRRGQRLRRAGRRGHRAAAALQHRLPGICGPGTQQCQGGSLACVPNVRPDRAETCNGLDDDCDGQTDEGDRAAARVQHRPAGRLRRRARPQCQGGAISCVPNVSPGHVRDLQRPRRRLQRHGRRRRSGRRRRVQHRQSRHLRAPGVDHCQGGALALRTDESRPRAETCNGLDDNCNGATDEPFVDLGSPCTVGVGACAAQRAMKVCLGDGTGTTCNATPGSPAPETCDGMDNDCDGAIDEGNPGGGGACTTGQPGVCAAGTDSCQRGGLVCVREQPADDARSATASTTTATAAPTRAIPAAAPAAPPACPASAAPARGTASAATSCASRTWRRCPRPATTPTTTATARSTREIPAAAARAAPGSSATATPGRLQCQSGALQCVQASGPTTELCANGHDEDCDGYDRRDARLRAVPAGEHDRRRSSRRRRRRSSSRPSRTATGCRPAGPSCCRRPRRSRRTWSREPPADRRRRVLLPGDHPAGQVPSAR